ncbi:unnamed protein product [Haemonchus placei]|uniref:AraC family transcriptional regulator n=1 Tax=Haemonchus placei TaxID=6290 RepID=A0A0N4WMU3_HAEPC|nr:unnamed protein product [Haemonchus placei]
MSVNIKRLTIGMIDARSLSTTALQFELGIAMEKTRCDTLGVTELRMKSNGSYILLPGKVLLHSASGTAHCGASFVVEQSLAYMVYSDGLAENDGLATLPQPLFIENLSYTLSHAALFMDDDNYVNRKRRRHPLIGSTI